MRRTALALFCLAAILPGRSARAAFVDLGFGARAPGMGNAFTAVADDAYAVHYNPAGLAQLDRPQVSMAYSRLYMGLSDGSDIGTSQVLYAHPLRNKRWGAIGGAWQNFSVSDLYSERSLYLSWGREFWSSDGGGHLLSGLSLKWLDRSFESRPEASNALSGLAATGRPDPVLSGNKSANAIDADLGFLYRFPTKFQLGLMIQHLNEPDVGFASTDKLKRNFRLAASYRSLWMNLASELHLEPAPGGSTDKSLLLAGERFFPTLTRGQFGVRGSLGFGSRDWRQLTTGLTYRINKIQTDYAFILPLGTVTGTAGTHRVAMTFHFGAPSPEDEMTHSLLMQSKQIRQDATPAYEYEFIDALRPRDLADKDLKEVSLYVEEGRFRQAHLALIKRMKDLPADRSIIRLSNRLAMMAYFYPDMTVTLEEWQKSAATAIRHFLHGRDKKAVLHASYALSLRREDAQLDKLLANMEEDAVLVALRLPAGHPRTFLEELRHKADFAYNRGEKEEALALLNAVLEIKPNDADVLAQAGSMHFLLKQNAEALANWKKALAATSSEGLRAQLRKSIADLEAKQKAKNVVFEKKPNKPAPSPKAKPRVDPRDIQLLYQRGVEFYMHGKLAEAGTMFRRILQLDPTNAQAQKALDRLETKR